MEASSAIQPGMLWRDVRIWAQLLIAMRNLHLYQVVVCLLKLLSHELSPECLSQNNHLCCPPCRERGTFRSFFQWVKVSSCKAFNMYVLRQAFKPCYHRTHVNAVTTRLWDVFRKISHVEDDVLCTKKKVSVKEKQWDAESPGPVSSPVTASCPNTIFPPFIIAQLAVSICREGSSCHLCFLDFSRGIGGKTGKWESLF